MHHIEIPASYLNYVGSKQHSRFRAMHGKHAMDKDFRLYADKVRPVCAGNCI